jgi:putative peptide zinc metalloprotease protein
MNALARTILVVLAAHAALFLSPVSAASAQTNSAGATNTKDGKSVFKLAFSVKKASGDVDASNTAVAYANCTDCKTVAAAIQVVLVSGDVDSFSAENVSLAVNYDCTECETLAAAYQFIFGNGQELEFTKEGKARLHELKKQFHDLKQRDDLTLDQLAAEIAAIAGEVAEVVDTEVQVKKAAKDASAAGATSDSTSTTDGGSGSSSTTTSPPTTTTGDPVPEATTTTPTTTATGTEAEPTSTTTPTTVAP